MGNGEVFYLNVLLLLMISGAFALPHMPDDSMQLRSSLVLLQLCSQQVLDSSTSVLDEVHPETPSIVLQPLALMQAKEVASAQDCLLQ